jgi:catechol 2,3-dioxygenase-like lactoylglutathione lyase family enzyme
MYTRRETALFLGSLLMSTDTLAAAPTASPRFVQDSMNVFRRFHPEQRAKMVDFYHRVLGLRPLQPIDLGGGQQMILFGIGSGQIKLSAGIVPGRSYNLGPVNSATGIRLFTLFFADEAALVERLQAFGQPAPIFGDGPDGRRAALVEDPAGFPLQLVIVPDAAPQALAKVEVGINVSDLARSRAFYRDFVGLEELPPVEDPLIGVAKYPYRHGETTINLWSAGDPVLADTGSAGIQYVVGNVDAVAARAAAEGVTVETPLANLPGFALRTVWLNDPDGVTNYFAQVGGPVELRR